MENKKESKKNFWIVISPILAIMIGYGSYMIYSYKSGRNNDFERRYGLVISEKQMMEAALPRGDVMNAFEAIAIIRDNTDVLEKMDERKKDHASKEEYHWKATAVKDAQMKDWDVLIREYKIKPKLVCKGKVSTSTQKVEAFRCFMSKI